MKIIDLTHVISQDMPVFPGTQAPIIQTTSCHEKDGFKETLIISHTHVGTHVDAPAHASQEGLELQSIPIGQFVGKAFVIDCTSLSDGEDITMAFIDQVKAKADEAEFIFFYTGWDKRWGTDEYFVDYPCIDDEVIDYLISANKKGIGVDLASIDPVADEGMTIHKKLFKNSNMIVIENLVNLDKVRGQIFTYCGFPLKHLGGDGSPVRAVAMLD